MRALVALALLGGAARADSFDAQAQTAEHLRHADDLVWALTATCTDGDDVHQRECRRVRDDRQKQLAGATLVIDGDAATFEIGAWNAAKKSLPVKLAGGSLHAGALYDNAKAFPDEAAATTWKSAATGAKVQWLVRVGAVKGKRTPANLGADVIGYRVYEPCSGAIVIANPAAAPLAPMDCKKKLR